MDMAVALVQSYLRVNGYFTVSEYPIIEAQRGAGYRVATDLDILAFRFPGAGRRVQGGQPEDETFEPDPALGSPTDRPDMLIGEVKEGKAILNPAARDRGVIRTALARFGCCPPKHGDKVVERLLRAGSARTPDGHQVRFVVFGGTASPQRGVDVALSLDYLAGFLRDYLREYWNVLHHAQFKDPALSLLSVLEKSRPSSSS